MSNFTSLHRLARAYIGCVVLLGSAAVLYSVYDLGRDDVPYSWLVLPALTLISGSITVKVPSIPATISVSEAFVFTAVLLYGPSAGTVTVALDGLIISLWLQRTGKQKEAYKAFFNMAAPSLSIWVAAQLYVLASGGADLRTSTALALPVILALGLLTLVYFLLNSFLIAFAIAVETGTSAVRFWRTNFLWLSLNYFGGASVALLLSPISRGGSLPRSLPVIVPILVISYLTYKTALGRMEDAGQHIRQLNSLYLSTIETLATAIDAKDQITHGHIRRVQLYAVNLAKKLGVDESPMMQAIEAAALLHDTGKLAVPEYILNKPGKLTPAEFEKMKLHATVGAEILSAIAFPYPVVPIVRHHHENWDGTGYPAGLKGTDIPIGARILSVVDCFDALTSDRPYRPKLPDAEAFRILRERRGTMYDPLVVDTFISVYEELGSQVTADAGVSGNARHIPKASRVISPLTDSDGLEDIATSSEEMLTLYDLAKALAGRTSMSDAGDVVAKHLRRLIPASVCVFFVYDWSSDELVVAHVTPDVLPVLGLRVPNGEGIAGWVAANRDIIVNADPTLDFGPIAASSVPPLRSCLSAPLVADDSLVGVLTLCSPSPQAFNDDHRRIVEAVLQQISLVARDSSAFDRQHSTYRDSATGLPNLERLRQLSGADEILVRQTSRRPTSVLFFTVVEDDQAVDSDGGRRPQQLLPHVVDTVRHVLRGADILFRCGEADFVVLLAGTEKNIADAIADRITAAVLSARHERPTISCNRVRVLAATATCPDDGMLLDELVDEAKKRCLRLANGRSLCSPVDDFPAPSSSVH